MGGAAPLVSSPSIFTVNPLENLVERDAASRRTSLVVGSGDARGFSIRREDQSSNARCRRWMRSLIHSFVFVWVLAFGNICHEHVKRTRRERQLVFVCSFIFLMRAFGWSESDGSSVTRLLKSQKLLYKASVLYVVVQTEKSYRYTTFRKRRVSASQ